MSGTPLPSPSAAANLVTLSTQGRAYKTATDTAGNLLVWVLDSAGVAHTLATITPTGATSTVPVSTTSPSPPVAS